MGVAMGARIPVWTSILRGTSGAGNARLRTFLWATLISFIFGVIQFGQPLEDMMRIGRNRLHTHHASGDIVIVALDDHSLDKLGEWPWPRRYHAALAHDLDRLGAKQILFDIDFSSASDASDDHIFAAELARLGKKVTLAIRFVVDPISNQRTDNFPQPAFREHVDLANINFRYNLQSAVWDLPYALDFGSKPYPSLASKMSGVKGASADLFTIDYSVSPRSIPVVSAVDILDGKVPRSAIAGKEVVIGTTSLQLGDIYFVPGYGRMSGVYLHVLGAETLKGGRPIDLGWGIPFLFGLLVTSLCLFSRRTRLSVAALAVGIPLCLISPLPLELYHINIDIAPALFLLTIVAGTLAWSRFRHSYLVRGTTNLISGLPNLNSLREQTIEESRLLIAARIQNYAEIASTLSPEGEKQLVDQIVKRLTVGAASTKLYQGDEGIFAWFAEPTMSMAVSDHLEALHALFRSPVLLPAHQIDLTITFGVDAGSDRSLVNRLGSALVAANEAAAEGLKWKMYDPEKLKDAAWKLSLLSQLDAAIEVGDLWIAYQPKLDLATRQIVGAEALARWTHPEKGPISPLEFISAAEQNDRIGKLTNYVLERSIQSAAAINGRGIVFDVSVNLSGRLIDDGQLVTTVKGFLAKHGLDPARLILEVTETAALASGGTHLETLLELRDAGIRISIDDYGTGLSTLDYLKKIPASEIKIDKSFVQAIETSHSDSLLVQSTIQLAHSLGQKVVAEGVEDGETLNALARMGCDMVQGFLIGQPMTFRALTRHLMVERRRKAA
jgi:EAL domain-containing protein (putative c-di-GMP-specific phosphodiesterase class I)/CHASE2 domain-containing sensor protein